MFVGAVNLGTTNFELVVVPLKGSELRGRWDPNTDLLLLCHLQTGRFCVCRSGDHSSRLKEYLGIGDYDAQNLAEWLKTTPLSESTP